MKKILLISSVIMLLVLLFLFTQAFVLIADAKAKDDATPGAKATEKAIEKANESAQEGENGAAKQNYKGTITSIADDGSSLEVKLADGTTVRIQVNDKTKVKIPGMGKSGTLADLKAGLTPDVIITVAVQASQVGDILVARQIHLIPGKPAKLHRVGEVTDLTDTSITVKGLDGESTTFTITKDTKILPKDRQDLLKVGATVTVISPRTFIGGPVAKGIVVHPEGGD